MYSLIYHDVKIVIKWNIWHSFTKNEYNKNIIQKFKISYFIFLRIVFVLENGKERERKLKIFQRRTNDVPVWKFCIHSTHFQVIIHPVIP